jgi:molecular chaperone GrpE
MDPKDQNDEPRMFRKEKDATEDEGAEDKLAKENQELKEKYVRLYSEFENFRRRTAKERLELINTLLLWNWLEN